MITKQNTPTLQNWLRRNFDYPLANSAEYRSGIVHRLDKETSGVLLVAKNKEAFENLQTQFKNRKVAKTYTALVHGEVDPKEGDVKVTVGRLPWNRERFGVLPGGREAVTGYKVRSYFGMRTEDGSQKSENEGRRRKSEVGLQNSDLKLLNQSSNFNPQTSYTLLELFPKTGRTHQIRIHLKHLGYPVVSDEFYAGRKTARSDRKWCPRLFLHAAKITISHPKTKKSVSFASALPRELSNVLASLEKLPQTP
ncbi:hypothetical protein A3A52_03470 [Candidatus Woesebacteria bacterium RIFCSPLOWO2_01_FULL_39_14]|uniref:Pseudouridine synthase RsuA/RluA-like domain-containing protein n=1 Tax=Candidatus Woesebacteria bacterium RIFCSPLOWO2_01_FULL_39_14 TaxID=1802518 RepID=A0A1F8BBM2_9BACT|nr:MAG: hypothetical protein A3A52_03470 [Candidatus Woesebacteria bacterium RIFCSPLOWO2_01_FULL_39_14]